MEHIENNSNLDKFTQEKVEKGIKSLLEEKKLKIKWRNEIEQDVTLQHYFKTYQDISVATFITNYITSKYNWFMYGDMYKKLADRKQSKWIELAEEHLQIILQKKLFDLQCLWRAELIKLEGIEICFDFDVWETDIFNCPLLDCITEDEVALYQEYLIQGSLEFYRFDPSDDWQNYEDIKENYLEGDSASEMPPWYEFHNLRTGNTKLLLLPDIRGDKEYFYYKLHFKNKEKIGEPKQPFDENSTVQQAMQRLKGDKRPYLNGYDANVVSFFVKTFEDRETQLKYKHFTDGNEHDIHGESEEYYHELLNELLEHNDRIPIEAHDDFKVAIVKAHKLYTCKKIAEQLPMAFKNYLFNRKMGFTVGEPDPFYHNLRAQNVENLLNGRELNGEERTLDF